MTDLKGDDYERAFYRDWNAGKVIDGNGKRMVPEREWQQLNAEDIKDIEGWVEFKEAGDNGPVPLGKLVLYISHKLREKNT